MVTINQTLNEIMQLDFSTREMLIEILLRRQIEERREEIFLNGKKAKAALKNGKLKSASAIEVIKKLNTLS